MSALEEIKIESRDAGSDELVQAEEGRHFGPQGYNMEFLKKRDEDLNITLIIAGLLSTVISAFIIYINPKLELDPSEESSAPLRVLIYKVDNTTFGGDVPGLSEWTGPTSTVVATQALLYLSLASTLGSALSAILAKQLLYVYSPAGEWRPRPEFRIAARQGLKCFILSLRVLLLASSLLLQFALLLFGCAVTVYLWKVNLIVASFVLAATLLALPLYATFGGLALANVTFSRTRVSSS